MTPPNDSPTVQERCLISVGSTVEFERPAFLRHTSFRGGLNKVGLFSYGNHGTIFYNVHIGRFCSIAHNVMIGPMEHPTDWLSTHGFVFNDRGVFGNNEEYQQILSTERYGARNPTIIGNDVWIGYGSFIRSGVKIGDGAIVAAQSTVLRDVPPYTIVGGSPAKFIKNRFDPRMTTRLLDLQWWNYNLDQKILGDIKYSDIYQAVTRIENSVYANELSKLSPPLFRMTHDGTLQKM